MPQTACVYSSQRTACVDRRPPSYSSGHGNGHTPTPLADLRDQLQVVGEDFGEALTLTVRGTPDVVARLRARLGGR